MIRVYSTVWVKKKFILLYILWKSVLSQIIWYHFCVVCVYAWMNRRHCLRECQNRLEPKLPMWCLNKTIGIWVLNRFLQIQITSLTKLIMPHMMPHIEYQISTNIFCARACVRVWLCFLLLQKALFPATSSQMIKTRFIIKHHYKLFSPLTSE